MNKIEKHEFEKLEWEINHLKTMFEEHNEERKELLKQKRELLKRLNALEKKYSKKEKK